MTRRRLGLSLHRLVDRWRRRNFQRLESWGWHLTPNHFYQPIPDTRQLTDKDFARERPIPGVELDANAHTQRVAIWRERFSAEFEQWPINAAPNPVDYHHFNGFFDVVDAIAYYCFIRERRPRRVIEIGSGWSTRIAAMALRQNARESGGSSSAASLTMIEPFPSPDLLRVFEDIGTLVHQPVQNVEPGLFASLDAGDILFIDSSHVVRTGSDVLAEFFDILPTLKPGVLVHFHDIFLPFEYPKEWVVDDMRFWNEQYLLQAFLAYNSAFEVRWAGHWLHHAHSAVLADLSSVYAQTRAIPASFWIERVG